MRRPVAAVEPPWSAPLDVVVLDARTGLGLPFARVRAKEEKRMAFSAQVDRTGLARLSRAFGAGSLELTLYDGLTGLQHETTVLHGPPPGGGTPPAFEWAIDVGPTYGLTVDTRHLPEGQDSLVALLREVGPGGAIRSWSSQDVSGERDGLLWLRYPAVEHEPAPGWRAFLHVWAPGTFFSGDVRVPATIGLHEHLTVVLEASAGGFRGRVTDADGRPVEAQVVVLGGSPVRLGFDERDSAWLELETDEEGRFEAAPVAPGKHAVIVRSNQRPIARAEVTIAAGAMAERSFVVGSEVQRTSTTGDVRGALVSGPGAGEPFGVLELDSVDGGGVSRVASTAWELFGKDPDGEERSAYEFTGLPRGRYRVRVVALDGRTYAPSEQVVEVPAVGVDFTTAQSLEQATVAYRIEVTDAGTGAPITVLPLCCAWAPTGSVKKSRRCQRTSRARARSMRSSWSARPATYRRASAWGTTTWSGTRACTALACDAGTGPRWWSWMPRTTRWDWKKTSGKSSRPVGSPARGRSSMATPTRSVPTAWR